MGLENENIINKYQLRLVFSYMESILMSLLNLRNNYLQSIQMNHLYSHTHYQQTNMFKFLIN